MSMISFLPLCLPRDLWEFIQDPSDAATPEQLAVMDSTISTLRESISSLKSELKSAMATLTTLTSAPTSSELVLRVEKLRKENEKKRERLEGYTSEREKLVTKEETERVDKDFRYWSAKRQARKRAFDELEDIFLAGMSREELWEKAGIEGED
jgi:26S proteasome regulatory subunit (ATPase 3-interacting protein)